MRCCLILTEPAVAYCIQEAAWLLHPGPTAHCHDHGPNSALYTDRLFGWEKLKGTRDDSTTTARHVRSAASAP